MGPAKAAQPDGMCFVDADNISQRNLDRRGTEIRQTEDSLLDVWTKPGFFLAGGGGVILLLLVFVLLKATG